MKNIRLGIKLLGGFLLTALIILAVGLLSIVQQGKLADETAHLGTEQLPAVENILIVKSQAASIAALMRSLLTPYASKEDRNFSHQQLLESRKVYGAAKEKFMTLPIMNDVKTEWQDFNTQITKWAGVNNQAVELSKELITLDMTNPTLMKDNMAKIEIAHNALLIKLSQLLLLNATFEGGTDDTTCSLGKWMQDTNTSNPDILALVKEVKPIHTQLHQHAAKIKELVGHGQHNEAKEIFEKKLLPTSEQVFVIFGKINAIADSGSEKFAKMNILLLKEGASFQTNTFAAVDKMVEAANKTASATIQEAKDIAARGRLITIVCLVLGIVLAIVFGFLLTRLITKPLFKGVDLAKAMADGDLTKTMDVDQQDEIGILAKSLNEMAVNLRGMFGDINNGVGRVDESSTQLAAIANQMSAGAESTATRSAQVAAAAEEMSVNQSSIAAAMEQAAVNVNMVAAAAEEMNATINEISSNSGKAKEITSQAVKQSIKASERVNELGKAADQINKVTETITEISEQTNLLALNATIEAARAGEAGKGFAVVANEIKELAKQTAAATLDIKTKIQGVQEATGVTVKEINEIGEVITDVDKIVATIAAAVEEQTATTKEIAQNVHQASQGIAEVNENVAQSSTVSAEIASDIATVNSSANEMNQASGQVKVSAEELSGIADRLKEMMAKFKT
ncbi:methyl-accepting chemotaxis protein [uncultured Desulfobulbus sp.]|uniref:HAMP domain-containing methyl-accepting chemotaxis protein n=1 Tax=uncultured Desulfobulbus sp. TaxID=239745 RepID=UPI0029C8FED8|nr:methyl-accepting chemotaxis protein [uncultured Desulfobulbus sp.]